MRKPRRLLAQLCSDTEAVELLTLQARSGSYLDLSSLLELQLESTATEVLGAMALEGLLRQASAPFQAAG